MIRIRKAVRPPVLLLLAALPAAGQGFRYWDPEDTAKAPRTLSATGLYADIAARRMAAGAIPFEVNSPLWSDGSAKRRWVLLKPGRSIGFKETDDYWEYPDSTIFIKQFALDTVAGDSTTRILLETRLLMLKKARLDPGQPDRVDDMWLGYSYRWRADQREADLVGEDGFKTAVRWYPQGRGRPAALKKWAYPRREDCNRCHANMFSDTSRTRSVLGFFTAQLNRPSPLDPRKNQLQDLFDRGKLRGSRPADWNRSHRWYGIDSKDTAATLERKARAYLAANCSGCHGDRGLYHGVMHADVNFDYHDGKPHQDHLYLAIRNSFNLDTAAPASDPEDKYTGVYEITPGYPGKSVMYYRQTRRNTVPPDDPDSLARDMAYDPDRDQMPPLATYEVNEAAMKVIGEWIESLPRTGNPRVGIRAAAGSPEPSPLLQGRILLLPPGLAGLAVDLVALDGRRMALRAASPGSYPLPASLPPGLYLLKAGPRVFKLLL